MITFIDPVGRTVIGNLVEETPDTIKVDNPVILHVQPDPQSGQLQVQSIPYLFVEFVDKDKRDTNMWTFFKSNIVQSDVVLSDKIASQYERVNTPAEDVPETEAVETGVDNVVNLFDK